MGMSELGVYISEVLAFVPQMLEAHKQLLNRVFDKAVLGWDREIMQQQQRIQDLMDMARGGMVGDSGDIVERITERDLRTNQLISRTVIRKPD